MANGSDGSIIIDTELDSSGFDKGSDRFLKGIQDLTGAVDNLGDNMMQSFSAMLPVLREVATNTSNIYAAMTGEGTQAAETVERVVGAEQTAAQEAQNMAEGARAAGGAVSSSMGTAGQSVSKLQGQLDRVNQQIAELQGEITRGENAKLPYIQQADDLRQKIKDAEAEAQRYQQMWATGSPGADRDQAASEAKVSALKAQYATVVAEIDKMDAALSKPYDKMDSLQQKAAALAARIAQAGGGATSSVTSLDAAIVKAGASALTLAKNLAKVAGNGVKAGFERLKDKIMSLYSANKRASLSSNGLVKALTSVKTLLKSRVKQMFISHLMNEIKQSMAALVQYSATFNASVSGMRNAARGLGANLAVAFSGLVNAVAPAITTIINLLSRAISYLNAFFAALSGKSTVTVAKKQTESYADSLKNAAGAAKNLKKAHQLLSFDELNILSSKKDGGSGGAGGTATPDLYEDVSVNKLLPEDVSAWFDSIKKAFEAGDWAGIGTAFSSGLNTAIAQVSPWLENTVQPLGVTWASRIAQILNGAVSGLDWTAVGTTLGAGINTVSATVDSFLTTFNFDNLGSGIATSLNGLFDKVNWEQLGATFGHAWQGLISTIHGFVTTADWAAIGTSIAEFVMGWFNAIDWNMLAETVSTGFIGVWTMISTALEGIDWQKIGRDLATAIGQIDWAGCAAAVFEGLGAALGALGGFLWGVFTTAWDGLTDMWSGFCESCRENGKMTISGFFKGIGEALANIGSWIVENIFTPFINGFKAAFGIHSPSTVMAEQGNFIVEGLLNGITAVWGTITDFFSGAVDGIKNILSGAWENIKTTASTAWSGITSTLGTAWNGIKEKASTTWNSIKTTASTVWGAIKTSLNDTWNNLKTTAGNTWDTIRSSASTAWESVKGAATQKWSDIKTTVVDLWDGLKSTVRESKWDDIGSNMVAGLKNGITGAWQGLKNKVGSLCNDLATKAKDTLGIKSPSKVFAEIGQYLDEGMAVGIDKGENGLLRTVRNLAGNVTNTMSDASPEVQIAGHATLAGMNNVTQALGGIADKFSAIAAVLNDMGGLKVPAIAAGTVAPYQTGLSGNGKDSLSNLMAASNEELISVIIQVANNLAGAIVSAIQQGNARPLVLDSESVTTGVINEINRRTLSSGESPLLA